MKELVICAVILSLLFFCYDMTTHVIPAPVPKSKLTEKQWRKLVKRCGGSTVVDADGNEKCFYTAKDLVKIKQREIKRKKIYVAYSK